MLEKAIEEKAKLIARALFLHDKAIAKALAMSLGNVTPCGYVVHSGARWTRPGSIDAIYLRDADGKTVASFKENVLYAGGFLTPTGYAAAAYLAECLASKTAP